jgi:hypothetical protein
VEPLAAKLQRNAPPACPAHVAPIVVVAPTAVPDASELDVIFKAAMDAMPPTIGAATVEPVGGPTLQPAKPRRPAVAAKNKRGRLEDIVEFKDIEPYLHLPQVEAADKLGFW